MLLRLTKRKDIPEGGGGGERVRAIKTRWLRIITRGQSEFRAQEMNDKTARKEVGETPDTHITFFLYFITMG